MAKQPKVRREQLSRNQRKSFKYSILFTVFFLVIKAIWLWQEPSHLLLGADGENYFRSLEGLLKDGLFSKEGNLHYWPSGYPILIWPLAELTFTYFPFLVGLLQICLYSLSILYFSYEVSKSPANKFLWPAFFFLNLNPTLALNAPAIGYEINAASLFLVALAALFAFNRKNRRVVACREVWVASSSLSLATFMQPRMILLAFGFFLIWGLAFFAKKKLIAFLLLTSLVISIAPTLMIMRNLVANDFLAISTNLGTTMNIGAGPESTGGYTNKATGVPCSVIEGNAAVQDSHRVGCVISWYLNNPSKTAELLFRKFTYHWSPWFGPLSNGTTARSPWIDVHPLKSTVQSQEGFNMVYGNSGKLISWVWVFGGLTLLGWGFLSLWRLKGFYQILALALLLPTLLNTASSMLTIGDHRFRMPTLSLSLLLQLFGLLALTQARAFNRLKAGTGARVWPGLNWKAGKEADNLPS